MKRSPLIILFITVVIDLFGFGMVFPLMPLYVKQFGGSPIVTGWMATSFSVMQFIFAPIWGRASDLYGRRPVILLGLFGSAVSFYMFGAAGSLWMLFASRVGSGILTAASLPAAYAYIADVTPPDKRSRGMAMIGVAFGIGFAFGPWIGGFLGSKYGLSVPAYAVAAAALANFVWSFFSLPETHTTDRDLAHARKVEFLAVKRIRNAFHNATLAELLTVFVVQNFAFSLLEATFSWFVMVRFLGLNPTSGHLTPDMAKDAAPTVNKVFGIVGVTILLVQGSMMSGMMHRIGEGLLVRVGGFVLTAAMFLIAGSSSIGSLMFYSALVAVGSGILNPSLSSLVSQAADPAERGGIMGVQQGLGSFTRIISPPVGTWLLQRFSTGAPYYLSGGLMAIGFLLSLALKAPIAEAPQRE